VTRSLARGRAARAVFQRMVQANTPVLFLDLDGTLAPLVGRPDDARVPPATRRTLARLRRTGARVVLVSGRSVDGVRHVARLEPDAILGDHGARIWRHGSARPWLSADRARLSRASRRLACELKDLAGVRLERKDRSLAIHLRLTRVQGVKAVPRIVRLLRAAGLRVLLGYRVIDGQLPGVDKGRAVRRWLTTNPGSDAVLYAGDDTTDQDALRALAGLAITIAVGPRVRGARFRTRDPRSLARWLERLADARSRR
jgi:trehalose-phosphatase